MTAHDVLSAARLDPAGGTLAGIARHAYRRAPIELVDRVPVSVESGIEGDWRGAVKPGGRGRRQITLIERGDWAAAMHALGQQVAWQERRVNLLVDGFDLPQQAGAMIRIGPDVLLEVTRECNPCQRMDELAPGLFAALSDDWRGGACARVRRGGVIGVGDAIWIEE